MQFVEKGSGPPLVVVPGLQGRWQYVAPAVESLSQSFRVVTFTLCDEPAAGAAFDPAAAFDSYVGQVRAAMDRCRMSRAVVCGISFGGLIALEFATAYPARTAALVLASTPGPGWRLRPRHQVYARLPYVFGPLFLAETPLRVRRELAASFPDRSRRWRFAASQLRTLWQAPLSLPRMARRARVMSTLDIGAEASRVGVPTLVVTGERGLDYVVPVDGSAGYLRSIVGARAAVIERSGHLGTITRPDVFARLVREFVNDHLRDDGAAGRGSEAASPSRGARGARS